MAPLSYSQKKRKIEEGIRGKTQRPKKRIRKQKEYHSSSEDEQDSDTEMAFAPVNLLESDEEEVQTRKQVPISQRKKEKKKTKAQSSSSESEDADELEHIERPAIRDSELNDDSDDASDTGGSSDVDKITDRPTKKKSKRNDPSAFANSMSKILNTKLPSSTRSDPVLARSREAADASATLSETKLEARARAKLRAERKEAMDRNRTTDVLGIKRGIAGQVAEEEKRLRKLATKGVIQLFNAFHAAHVRAEEAMKEERRKGTVGMANREEKRREMSKQGFLDLIGGTKKDGTTVNAMAAQMS